MPESAPSSVPLHVGAAWYPECWPEDQWRADVDRMKELGVNCVRLFESAWHRLEPREWEHDFEWANRALDMLKEADIGVVLATPTAAPPAWLVTKYPEVLATRPDGRRLAHGRRRHYSPVSARYREFCARIVDQMVHAFRGHDAVVGWQVDNELGGADYGPEARRAFHAWLHERFGHVDDLNKAWGLEFWSQAYEYFEQIPVPAIGDVGRAPVPDDLRHHPSLMLAFQRFLNDQWSGFVQTQCEVIRAGFDKPVSTNMTPNWAMNYFRQNHLMDRVAMTLDAPDLMHLDRMRAEKPGVPFWLLQTRASADSAPLTAWLATLAGAEMTLFHPWRQNWSGQDMSTPGIVNATGQWGPQKPPIEKAFAQLKDHAQFLADNPPVEARVAVVMSNESAWAFSIDPPEPNFNYEQVWRDEFYAPVARQHYWRDVIDQNADFCPYHVLLVPLVPVLFPPTKERLKEWVEGGGCLLVGPLTGHRNEEFTAWTDQALGGLEDLLGATCTGAFPVQPGTKLVWGDTPPEGDTPAEGDAAANEVPTSDPRGLGHGFTPAAARPLARYRGGHGDGQSAILMHKLGQGSVITLGCRVDPDTYLDLVHTLCELAKVEPLAKGSPDVIVLPRMKPDASIAAYGLVNPTDQPQKIQLPHPGTDRLTGRTVGPELDIAPHEVLLIETA
jgi:beta-galactosidase GanA